MTTGAVIERELALPSSPYVGLVPFSESDSAFFFGRDEWCDVVVDNLKAYRLTVLYGESGTGKTSLLRAGVVYELQEEARRSREERPRRVSASSTAPRGSVIRSPSSSAPCGRRSREAVDEEDPAGEHRPSRPRSRRSRKHPIGSDGRLFVILDQLEELFRYHEGEGGRGHTRARASAGRQPA